MEIAELLKNQSNKQFADFTKKLTPDTKYEILGIKVPVVKQIAKDLAKNNDLSFLKEHHLYYEEWLLHGFLISFAKVDFDTTISLLNEFLPHVDNWAICDSVSASLKPKLKKNKEKTFEKLQEYLKSDKTYTVRFAIVCLLDNFSTNEYANKIISITKNIKSEEYYINMALSWLYAEFVIKAPDKIVGLIESKTLPKFVQNKSIQKACESFRVPPELKEKLKKLKI